MLREFVTIKTSTGDLHGHLYVGADHFPKLLVDCGCPEYYRPASFPAAWQLQQAGPDAGILFCAWRTIMEMQWEIAQAERQAEDDAKERERERATENQIAMEIDHDQRP